MRVVFLGAGGPFSVECLRSVAGVAEVAALVLPGARGRGLRRVVRGLWHRRLTRTIRSVARERRIPVFTYGSRDLRAFGADLFVTASFPHLLDATLPAINVHSSLLPKHRGPDPIFWTYFAGDRRTGVTVHWLAEGVDDGDVILQREIDVPRGIGGGDLYARLSREAAVALADAVMAIADGTATRTPQDHAAATIEPSPSTAAWQIDFDTWTAERVWHFLRGYAFRTGARLRDRAGTEHALGSEVTLETTASREEPGTFRRSGTDLVIHCIDGVVRIR